MAREMFHLVGVKRHPDRRHYRAHRGFGYVEPGSIAVLPDKLLDDELRRQIRKEAAKAFAAGAE